MIIKLLSSFVYSALLSAVIRFEIYLYRRLVTHNFPPVILCCYHRTRLDIYIPQRWDDRLAVNLESKPLFTVSANTLILYASIRQHVGSWEPQVKTVLVRGSSRFGWGLNKENKTQLRYGVNTLNIVRILCFLFIHII